MSQRGKTLLSLDGYTYYHKIDVRKRKCGQQSILRKRWLCSTHGAKGCRAMVHTIGTEIICIRNEHTHGRLI